MFASAKLVLSCPLLRPKCMQRAVAGIDKDAGNAHVSSPVGVVEDWASAALHDSSIAAGWRCVDHRAPPFSVLLILIAKSVNFAFFSFSNIAKPFSVIA